MNEIKLFSEVFQHYGLPGIIILWIVWEKILHPAYKKSKGTYVSYKNLEDRLNKLQEIQEQHLKEDIRQFAIIDTVRAVQVEKNNNFAETLDRLEKGQQKIFDIISQLRNDIIDVIRKP